MEVAVGVADVVAVVVAEDVAVGFAFTGRSMWSVGLAEDALVDEEPSERLVVATGAVVVTS